MSGAQPLRFPPAESAEPAAAPDGLHLLQAERGAEDRVVDLLAFALAAAAREPVTPASIPMLRQRAEAELSGWAMRYLHNRVEEIRQGAVGERLAQLRRPPGLVKLVLANLLALGLVAAALWWLAANPDIASGLAGALGRIAALFQDLSAGLAGLFRG